MHVRTGQLWWANRRAQMRFKVYIDRMTAGEDATEDWLRYVEAEDTYSELRGRPRDEADEDAAHDAADWRLSSMTGEYTTLPDVPLADRGDHFAGMPS